MKFVYSFVALFQNTSKQTWLFSFYVWLLKINLHMIGFNFDYLCSVQQQQQKFILYSISKFRSIYWLLWVCTPFSDDVRQVKSTERQMYFQVYWILFKLSRILLLFNYFSVAHDKPNYEITLCTNDVVVYLILSYRI